MFVVTKLFTGGLLKGLTIEEEYSFRPTKLVVNKPAAGSPYEIIEIREGRIPEHLRHRSAAW